MSDPVAEAAAQIAAQQAEPSMLAKAMDTIHDLEAKVEHLIHPDAVQSTVSAPVAAAVLSTLDTLQAAESVPNVTPESPAIDDSATLSDGSGQSIENASSAKRSDSLSTGAPVLASAIELSALSATIPTSSAGSDLPNVLPASTSGIAEESMPNAITMPDDLKAMGITTDGPESEAAARQFLVDKGYVPAAEVPNAVSGAAESTTVTDSASPASGSGETSSIGASSGEDPNAGGTTATATVDSAVIATPTSNSASHQGGQSTTLDLVQASSPVIDSPLHVRVAAHLEAIFSMVKEAAPTPSTDAIGLKTHVGDILHRISNGMAVTEGELVQKLESLYRML